MNRNEFIRTGGRILILGGMAISAGYLMLNDKIDISCAETDGCGRCDWFTKCTLPDAMEVKDGKK